MRYTQILLHYSGHFSCIPPTVFPPILTPNPCYTATIEFLLLTLNSSHKASLFLLAILPLYNSLRTLIIARKAIHPFHILYYVDLKHFHWVSSGLSISFSLSLLLAIPIFFFREGLIISSELYTHPIRAFSNKGLLLTYCNMQNTRYIVAVLINCKPIDSKHAPIQ